MEEQNESVNIYLYGRNKEKILEGASPHERYIILMNETLQSENRELKNSLKELEVKNEELEGDSDRSEISKKYTIGLLKNFAEIDKMRSEVVLKNVNINKFNKTYVNDVHHKAKLQLRYLQALLFSVFGVFWEVEMFSFEHFSFVLFIVIFILSFIERLVKHIIIPSHEDEEKEIEELLIEIKKITDAQDYLHEYLDAI